MRISVYAFGGIIFLVYAFLLIPFIVVLLTAVNSADYLSFPPQGFSLRWFVEFLKTPSYLNALSTSLLAGVLSAVLAAAFGTPAAIFYVRHIRKRKELYRGAILSPLILPEILTAIALLFLFSQIIGVYRNIGPLVLSHAVAALPFAFLTVTAALYNMPPNIEEAARTLGASSTKAFCYVTFPLIKSGVITGALLSFILSFDNVNLSLLLNPQGQTTLPILLMDNLRHSFDATSAAASVISAVLTLSVVLIIDRLYGLNTVRF